ncbi:hypothetical protein ACPA0F_20620 [Solibacillus silvestris]
MAVGPCSVYGIHKMKSPVTIGVRDMNGDYINTRFKLGSLFKCACGERIITQGSPNTGDYIRDYVTEGGITRGKTVVLKNGTVLQYVPSEYVYYIAQSTLEGYSFSN